MGVNDVISLAIFCSTVVVVGVMVLVPFRRRGCRRDPQAPNARARSANIVTGGVRSARPALGASN